MADQTEANFAALIESTEDLIGAVDLDFGLITFNRAFQRYVEQAYGVRAAVGMHAEDAFPSERAVLWLQLFNRALSEGPFRVEYTLLDGRTLELAFNPIMVEGEKAGVSVFGKDITERKLSEIQLRDSEERYRAIFEQAAIGILRTSLDGRIQSCNKCFAQIVGYPLDEIPGMTFHQITAPEDLDESTGVLNQLANGTISTASWEKRYIRKDGSLTWVRLTVSTQRDGGERALHFIAVVEDINARKTAEERLTAAQEALRASEARYRTVFLTSPDLVDVNRLDDGTYVDANEAYLNILGFKREEIIGRTSSELNIWADPRDRQNFVQMLRRNSTCRNLEARFRKKNGEIFSGLVSAAVTEIDGVSCIVSVTKDISDVKEAAEKIRDLAFYDPLTHLPNRRLLLDRLGQTPAARICCSSISTSSRS